jgi:hypothetical protein
MSVDCLPVETQSAVNNNGRLPYTFQCACGRTETRFYLLTSGGKINGLPPKSCKQCKWKRAHDKERERQRANGVKPASTFWTVERKAEVRRQWDERKSGTEIGTYFGVSRAAILGLLHRMGALGGRIIHRTQEQRLAAKRARYQQNNSRPRKLRSPARANSTVLPPPVVPALPSLNHTIQQVTGCRYPYGNGPYSFCGHAKHEGSSYCPAHHKATHWRPT